MPCILCGPALPPDKTGDDDGSTAITFILLFFSFKYSPTPVIVPPVPTAEIKISIFPSISLYNSFAVDAL